MEIFTFFVARSGLLESYFSAPHCELYEGKKILHISDLDSKIVQGLLQFCYTGDTELFEDFNTTCKVLEAAHHLGVTLLKCQCLIQLVSNFLEIDNYVRIALLEFKYAFRRFNCGQVILREFIIL